MSSELQQQAAKIEIEKAGQVGTKGIFPSDDDKIVVSTNMKNGAYTVAAQPIAPCLISVLQTAVGAADTSGKVTIVGTDINGTAITEEVTPIAGTTVYTTKEFASITSATGSGWTIAEGNDTIKIGVSSAISSDGYYFSSIQVVAVILYIHVAIELCPLKPEIDLYILIKISCEISKASS
jgi:hypothetical protein